MRRLIVASAVLLLFGIAFTMQWLPLGAPSEWAWERLAPDGILQPAPWFVFALPLTLALAIAAGIYRWLPRIGQMPRGRFVAIVAGACLLGSAFQLTLEIASPAGLAKWCMFAGESADSYYFYVRRNVPTIGDAIAGHADFCQRHCFPHLSTNPAGWVVVHRALLSFYEAHPVSARRMYRCELAEMTQGSLELVGVRLPYADRAALLTVAYGSRLMAWLVGPAIAWLVGMRLGRGPALIAAAASYLVPASVMFAPRSDTVYPTFATLILALSYHAVKRTSWMAAAAAAALVAAGMMFSLCFSVVAAMAAILVGLEFFRQRRVDAKLTVAALAAFSLLVLATELCDYSPFRVWWANLQCNKQIIGNRTPWLWALINPLEMAAAMGLPAAVFLIARVAADVHRREFDSLLVAWFAALLALNFSGASLGEVARLWVFAMPVGVVLAVERLDASSHQDRAVIAGLLTLQALACLTLSRDLVVVGFS